MRAYLVFCLVPLLFTSPNLDAQSSFGVTGGLNYSTLINQNSDFFWLDNFWEPKLGFNVGVTYQYGFSKKLGFRTEVMYSLAGATSSDDDKMNLHYVSVPVSFYYNPWKKIKLLVGPQINFLLRAKYSAGPYYFPNADEFNTVDFGIQSGLQFYFTETFSVSVKNYFGLVYSDEFKFEPIQDGDPPIGDYSPVKINRNNIFQVNLYYTLKSAK